MKRFLMTTASIAVGLAAASAVQANPLTVASSPVTCDGGAPPTAVHELGTAPAFPADELISSVATLTTLSACAPTDDPGTPNTLVSITNLTQAPWKDLWFVSDNVGNLSNVDAVVGEVTPVAGPPGFGFKIDNVGLNQPLIANGNGDGWFDPGETWTFIVQDWLPFGFVSFGSLGIGGVSLPFELSNASIIATPEPAALAVLGLGLGALGFARRKRNS